MTPVKSSIPRLAAHLALISIGVVIMLGGYTRFYGFGLAFVVLGSFFSSRQPKHPRILLFCIALFLLSGIGALFQDYPTVNLFDWKKAPLWYVLILAAAWIGDVINELWRWRKNRIPA